MPIVSIDNENDEQNSAEKPYNTSDMRRVPVAAGAAAPSAGAAVAAAPVLATLPVGPAIAAAPILAALSVGAAVAAAPAVSLFMAVGRIVRRGSWAAWPISRK